MLSRVRSHMACNILFVENLIKTSRHNPPREEKLDSHFQFELNSMPLNLKLMQRISN